MRQAQMRWGGVAVLVMAALMFSGCGGSSSDGSAPTTEAPSEADDAAGLEAAARSLVGSVLDQDWSAAYDRLTSECKAETTRTDWIAGASSALDGGAGLGLDMSQATIAGISTRSVSDGYGEVWIDVRVPGDDLGGSGTWDQWVYEAGMWRPVDCGDFESDPGAGVDGSTDATVGGDLRPADQVVSEQNLAAASIVGVGETGTLRPGLTATVSSMQPTVDGGEAALEVTVHIENRSTSAQAVPDISLTCAGSTASGMWTLESGSSGMFEGGDEMPSGTFADGVLLLYLPSADPFAPDVAPVPCEGPAHVWITDFESDASLAIEVPDDVFARLLSPVGTA